MNQLIVLGTGNAMVTRCYNTCFALEAGEEIFLVDAGGGNGILGILDRAGIDAARIHHVFVTHAHTDHILGIPWILRKIGTLMLSGAYEGNLTIHCHDRSAQAIETIAALTIQGKFVKLLGERILFDVVQDRDTRLILGCETTFFDILSTKAKQFGFWCRLPNGKRLCCIGDEPCNPACEQFAQDADWLLCEAFCLYADRARFRPYEKHHSTVKEACELAQRLRVKNLVLWHTEDKTIEQRRARYTAEGKEYFSGNLLVPQDLDVIKLS